MVQTRSKCPTELKRLGKCRDKTKSTSKPKPKPKPTKTSENKCMRVMSSCTKMVQLDRKLSALQQKYVKLTDDFDEMILPNKRNKAPRWATGTMAQQFRKRAAMLHEMSKLNTEVKRLEAQYEAAKKQCYAGNPKGNLCRDYTNKNYNRNKQSEREKLEKKRLSNLRSTIRTKIRRLENPVAKNAFQKALAKAVDANLNWLNLEVSANLNVQKNNLT
jgi:hypothetical protein